MRLRSKARAQCGRFDESLDLFVRTRSSRELQEVSTREQSARIRDMQPAGRQVAPCVAAVRQTRRCSPAADIGRRRSLRTLSTRSRSYTNACPIHKTALRNWKEDLDELQAARSPPSRAAVASKLKGIVGGISEIKKTIEIAEIMAPRAARRLYQVI